MYKAALYFTLLVFLNILYTCDSKATESDVELREILSSEIKGSVIFSKNRYICKVVIGKWTPVELGRGDYARWSPDGKKIAVYDRRKIYVMDDDGSSRKLVSEEAWEGSGCPIEFHANGHEIIFTRRKEQGLWAVDINNGQMRKLLDIDGYPGEIGMSADGMRMAYRLKPDLYAIDLANNNSFIYLKDCGYSAGISPDGKWLMNNTNNGDGSHESMNIRSWDGKQIRILRAAICQPDREWGHHTWSNHSDYITAQGGLKGESYVIKLSANQGTRVTWEGKTVYPDLYVAEAISENKPLNMNNQIEDINFGFWLLAALPSITSTDEQIKLPITNINRNYNRLASHIMIRRIPVPTRANLDLAFYDSNVMFYNKSKIEHKPLAEKELPDLHFDRTIIPESLADRLLSTPLTSKEVSSPMSWAPMTEYLIDRNFDQGYTMAETGWKVSEDSWGDDSITEPYQEISRAYIHTDGNGKHELWVRIEFRPWVKFLKDIDDEDKDGFREIYGMLDKKCYSENVINQLLSEYTKRILSEDEIIAWGYKTASDNYDKYATVVLKHENDREFPNEEIKSELGDLVIDKPEVIIRGRPFGEAIYNVFIVH